MVLDSGRLPFTNVLTSHELSGNSKSPPFDIRLQADEVIWLLLQMVESEKLVTEPKTLSSLGDSQSHESLKAMDSKILCRFMDLQSIYEACGLKLLLNGETCTSMSVTRQVSYKV